MLHRSVVERYGPFKTTLLFLTDWGTGCGRGQRRAMLLDESLATFRLQPAESLCGRPSGSAQRGTRGRERPRYRPRMIHDEHYAPVRRAARQCDRPVDLEQRLLVRDASHAWRVRRLEDREHGGGTKPSPLIGIASRRVCGVSLPLWRCLARLAGLKLRHWRVQSHDGVRSVRARTITG